MIKLAEGWDDYRILATGGGFKMERWGKLVLLRPDPQVIWAPRFDLEGYNGINAVYRRSNTGGGAWQFKGGVPGEFEIGRRGLRFSLKLMGFKHTGLFPEQAVNWDEMSRMIREARRQISVLNLFGYTGGATVACAAAGAKAEITWKAPKPTPQITRAAIRMTSAPRRGERRFFGGCCAPAGGLGASAALGTALYLAALQAQGVWPLRAGRAPA